MSVEIVNEPTPPPRPGARSSGGCRILLVEEKTQEIVNEVMTPYYVHNDRRPREERKY